jgi:hypothetical protein
VPLLFMGSCVALIPAGMKIADPLTIEPIGRWDGTRFPVVLMTGDTPRVVFMTKASDFAVPPPAGSSYLIPSGKDRAVEAALNRQRPPDVGGRWVLHVARPSPDRQKIELYSMNDGYRGGGYEATNTTVTPRYRKITGPGFGCVAGGVAILINAALWSLAALVFRVVRRGRASG